MPKKILILGVVMITILACGVFSPEEIRIIEAQADVATANAVLAEAQATAVIMLAQAEHSKSPAGGVATYKEGFADGEQEGAETARTSNTVTFWQFIAFGLIIFIAGMAVMKR